MKGIFSHFSVYIQEFLKDFPYAEVAQVQVQWVQLQPNFFSQAVFHSQNSIKTCENSGISPEINGIWFSAPLLWEISLVHQSNCSRQIIQPLKMLSKEKSFSFIFRKVSRLFFISDWLDFTEICKVRKVEDTLFLKYSTLPFFAKFNSMLCSVYIGSQL